MIEEKPYMILIALFVALINCKNHCPDHGNGWEYVLKTTWIERSGVTILLSTPVLTVLCKMLLASVQQVSQKQHTQCANSNTIRPSKYTNIFAQNMVLSKIPMSIQLFLSTINTI